MLTRTTIRDIILRLLPNGTNDGKDKKWNKCPLWPPDAFAVVAKLVSISGCYTNNRFTSCGCGGNDGLFNESNRDKIKDAGKKWRKGRVPPFAQFNWKILYDNWSLFLGDEKRSARKWWDAAVLLLVISDEASKGIGFWPQITNSKTEDEQSFVEVYFNEWGQYIKKGPTYKEKSPLPFLPYSLCRKIPPEEACVQPKSGTSQLGCTLRSFSHHLALLPPRGEVETLWHIGSGNGIPESKEQSLNLLLIPYPYNINGQCFKSGDSCFQGDKPPSSRFFSIVQKWFPFNYWDLENRFIPDLIEIIKNAQAEVGKVHGVIFPEASIGASRVSKIASSLSDKYPFLELFIAGTIAQDSQGSGLNHNSVFSVVFGKRNAPGGYYSSYWYQFKHHRWFLDRQQITRYHLGHALNPMKPWWEGMAIKKRICVFQVFRHGATLASLICEDLARIDPVQTVLRAVGPSLVVVLLMDGPQLEKRWPGRYATILADDPGSSVLTLTSVGMIRRASMPTEESSYNVALWKEPDGIARELSLPAKSHALVLTLSLRDIEEWSMDGRSDGCSTVKLSLTGVRAVTLNKPKYLSH
jgi:hypothetical protein